MAGPVELRAVPWPDVLLPLGIGYSLLGLTAAGVLGGPAPPLLWLGLGAVALGVAACLDDRAAPVASAAPMTRRRRTAQRLCVPAVVVAGWCAYAAAVDGVKQLSGPELALTGSGLILAVLAVADLLRQRGHDEPGAAVGSVVQLMVVGCVFFQPFAGDVLVLRAYDDPGPPSLPWTIVSGAAAISLWWSTTDPGRPRGRPPMFTRAPRRRRP